MKKLRIAIPTETRQGLEADISEVFGRTKTFTIIDVEDTKTQNIEVFDNPGAGYPCGSGPLLVKTLADLKVNLVIATQFGISVLELLDHLHIQKHVVQPDLKVAQAIQTVLSQNIPSKIQLKGA